IEELAGVATWRLVKAAEKAGVKRFLFFSTLGASTRGPTRLLRAKALAEQAVIGSSLDHTVFAPSFVYSPGDPFLRILERLSLFPVVPVVGSGRAPFQPIWAEEVAACLLAALPGGTRAHEASGARYELAGPEVLTYEEIVRCALRSFGRRRLVARIPRALVRRTLKLLELVMGPAAFATWDEVQLLEVPTISSRGTADVELLLGARPRPMAAVLGAG
ncbi:MAG TPA: NAD(P)H-binding protein, partial [Solirubrobacteraceae bacterium]